MKIIIPTVYNILKRMVLGSTEVHKKNPNMVFYIPGMAILYCSNLNPFKAHKITLDCSLESFYNQTVFEYACDNLAARASQKCHEI